MFDFAAQTNKEPHSDALWSQIKQLDSVFVTALRMFLVFLLLRGKKFAKR